MSKSTTRPDGQKLRFKVGSTAFFSMYPDFHPNDVDEVEFEDEPRLYKNFMQFRKKNGTRCLFKWRRMTADEFVNYTLNSKLPMEIGKFLVPEVARYLGFTIEHLKQLKPVAERLDGKHKYEQIIFNAYMTHGNFTLTQDERDLAYEEYKKMRRE